MALGTDHFVAADLAASIPEIWTGKTNDFYRSKLVCAGFFTDRSDEVRFGGDILHTTNTAAFSANSKAAQTQVTLQDPADSSTDLTIDQHYHAAFMIEDKELAQVARSYNVLETKMKDAAYAVAKQLDTAIATLFSGFSTTTGATTTALTDADILSAYSGYATNDAPLEEAAWILHPKTIWEDVQALDKYTLVQNTGVSTSGPLTGEIGTLWGRPVLQSTNVQTINAAADYAGFFGNPDAIHFACAALPGSKDEMMVRLQSEYRLEYLGILVVADMLYGVIENRDAAGIQVISAV